MLPIRSYTTADGLASDHIACIVPDSRGFIWFCTSEGLTRFDGYRMVSFGTADGLPHRSVDPFLATRSERIGVTDILEDPGGQLWVATIDGIFVLGRDGAVKHIAKKDGLPDNW